MPLKKPSAAPVIDAPAEGPLHVPEIEKVETPKYTGRKSDVPMSKEDYWRRKEERDIEKDHRIGRSGMFQAALQSTALIQYTPTPTLEDYLALVRKVAEAGLSFVNEESK